MRLPPSLAVSSRDPTPLYAQLERGVRVAIATGQLASGDQLPTVRQLAVELKVNANTVARVYADLERQGVLETRRGVGTFVAARPADLSRRRSREPELRALVVRLVSEISRHGFSIDEVVEELTARVKRGD